MDLVEMSRVVAVVRHPWEEARLEFFVGVLDRATLLRPGVRILDVGAGDAWFAARLAEHAPRARIRCWDPGWAERPLAAPPRGVLAGPPGGDDRSDLVLLLDVAEHVDDDRGLLRAIVEQRLAAGGHLLFSVPAWPALRSSHDDRLKHRRRYAPAAARVLLTGAGLAIRRSGGLFHSLVVARGVRAIAERLGFMQSRAPHAGEWRGSPLWTAAVLAALRVDATTSAAFAAVGVDVPGLSWWALCRKA